MVSKPGYFLFLLSATPCQYLLAVSFFRTECRIFVKIVNDFKKGHKELFGAGAD